ncbi:MAG: family 78 glycoside hydrolase catalytic domain, partial [Bacteroidota bacterium]
MKLINAGIVFFVLLTVSCGRMQDKNERNVFFENRTPQWIGDGQPLPANDSLYYLDYPAPLFRKEIAVENKIENARFFITAAGYYKFSLNGKVIGSSSLNPAWTDYSKRIYYSDYDVTSMITKGENCLGVELGNGFYNPLPLRMWGRYNLREDLKVGKPVFLAKLVLKYENGKTEEFVSGETWKYTSGPTIRNSVYLGVTYDAGKEIEGWNTVGFNDKSWVNASLGTSPGGQLEKAFFPSVQITEQITPISIFSPEEGIYTVDMGVNFTGTYRIRLSGNIGDTIRFRFGERIYEDGKLNPMTVVTGQIKRKGTGGPGAPDIAW